MNALTFVHIDLATTFDCDLQHSPLAKSMLCVCLIKNYPQNPVGEKGRRKEYITHITYVAPVASLKTLHEKIQWEKLIKGKKSTIVDVRLVFKTDS